MRSFIPLLTALLPATLAAECAPLHFVYARATTEPPAGLQPADFTAPGGAAKFEAAAAKIWSQGYGAAGASLYKNITKLLPGTTGWPVHYPAGMGGADLGNKDMLDQLSKQSTACPKQKFVLGGHSQGGMVTVSTIPKIPKDILAKVVAVTMFGSPPCPEIVKDRCNSYCNKGDFVCDGAGGAKGGGGMPKAAGGGLPKGVPKATPKGTTSPPKTSGETDTAPKTPTEPPMADMPGMPAAAPQTTSEAPKGGMEGMAGMSGMKIRAAADGDDCTAEVKRTAKSSKNAHLAYNEDGYYIGKAACFAIAQFKKMGGA
ncbi:hypothetical protein EG328_005737 [Venturia inaequalis]|uniref:Alpha/beta-hydrolase n=1 Tax=Venturia inaequalis TaxID=5025 RepID=A0A8H3UT89_VENIN|nr:hypothetical protein EG328_005737 [Venturia inaequalis]KAE9974883.1 hypothetical protein EG327_008635 [Venturia inaequalis]RDI78295.1 hypothetical protein Vi05172_g11706 [Venturia inaequalis]